MPQFLFAFLSLFITIAGLVAQASGDTRAVALLAKARAAIGGDAEVAKVQGLSCTGTVTRAMGDRQISGELTLELQLPDKMLRTETISPMGDSALIVTEQGVNADTLLRNVKTVNAPAAAMIRTPPPPAPGSDAEAQALRNSRAELARIVAAMLLSSSSSVSVEFAYGGEAESPDGKADVLDLRGAEGFVAKLFLDKVSHRALMLAYRGVAPRMVVQQAHHGSPGPTHTERPERAPTPPEIVDINMFVDDYKPVNGLMLPHHITRAVDGQTTEEVTCKTITVNPSFTADTFVRK